jgi:hypothetical protein
MTLKVAIEKPMRSKALLAIAFAGGMLNSQLPTFSETETKSESTDSIIQKIANSTQNSAESRAFYLLTLAHDYLIEANKTTVEAKFTRILNETDARSWPLSNPRVWESILVSWADMVSLEARPKDLGFNARTEAKANSPSKENLVFANTAIEMALTQLDKASEKYAKLNLYFIASQLFRRTGNTDGVRRCNEVLEEAFQSCEGGSPIDEEQTRATSSILNSMANGLLPVQIPDLHPRDNPLEEQTPVKPFTEKDFKESEKLKLRAVAMLDRLDTQNHLRRKAHRDLALWYKQLGKVESAEREKQILFELVGTKDDSILYPQQAGCGQLLWWVKEKRVVDIGCGMG